MGSFTKTLTLGCDPEFFLFDTQTQKMVSAHDLVPGNKADPHPLKHGAIQADGLAVEFNIDPASTAKEFEHNIVEVLSQIRKMIPKRYDFKFIPLYEWPKEYYDSLPNYSKELGCDPDFNFSGNINGNPKNRIRNIRTTSGHIHFGWGEDLDVRSKSLHFEDCKVLSHALCVGVDLFLQQTIDPANKDRKIYYGMDGSFRPKKYGMEYRGLSSTWVCDKKYYKPLFDICKETIDLLSDRGEYFYYSAYYPKGLYQMNGYDSCKTDLSVFKRV